MDQADASFRAGETKAQAQEKCSQTIDKVKDKAESARQSIQETGEQMVARAEGAADAIKDSARTN